MSLSLSKEQKAEAISSIWRFFSDEKPTANALMLKVLDQIYVVSLLPPSPSPTN